MAGCHQREHHFLDHARLPDDGLADAGAQLAEQVGGFLDGAGFSVPCFDLLDSRRRLRRFEHRDRIAQLVRVACPGEIHGRPELVPRLMPLALASAATRSVARHVVVVREALNGRVAQRAQRGRVQRRAAAEAQRELPGAADLFGERAARGLGRRGARTEARTGAPQRQGHAPPAAAARRARRSATAAQQRRVIFFGEEHDDVAALQLRRRHEQLRMVAEQEIAIAERRGVDHRDAAAPHRGAQRVDSVLVAQGPEDLALAAQRVRPVHVADFELAIAAVFGERVTIRIEESFGEGVDPVGKSADSSIVGFFRLIFFVRFDFLCRAGDAAPGFEFLDIHDDRIVDDQAAAAFDPALQAFPARAAQRPVPVRHQDHGIGGRRGEDALPGGLRAQQIAEADGRIERIARGLAAQRHRHLHVLERHVARQPGEQADDDERRQRS